MPIPIQTVILKKFRALFSEYKQHIKSQFKSLNKQDAHLIRLSGELLENVNHFIRLEDERGNLLYKYQKRYNRFLKVWKDLILKEDVKEEQHKR